MISVAIPVYNVEKYLSRCLDSVLNQSYDDLEIILINDGSIDNSEKICLEYAAKDARIIYVKKQNQGLGYVRNLALKMASGEYFTAIDSDDWWDLDYCKKMIDAITEFDADIAICDFSNVEIEGEKIVKQTVSRMRITPREVHNPESEPELINTCRTIFCAKLFKVQFLRNTQVLQPNFYYEDMATVPLLTVCAKSIIRVDEALYFYLRNRCDSTTNTLSTKSHFIRALELLVDRFKERNFFYKYHAVLKKKNHSDVRFILNSMTNSPERESIKKDLCDFLAKNYPTWINITDYTFCVIGSEQLHKSVASFLFDVNELVYFATVSEALSSKYDFKCDFLFFDGDNLELISDCPNTHLYNFSDEIITSKFSSVTHLTKPEGSEDFDCAMWDLSDLIFYNLRLQ